MIYGYIRVSTKGQDKYGNSTQDQNDKLTAAGCQVIYKDSFTGTKMDRPQFSKLMQVLKDGDTLIVTKLDRFARNASEGAKTMHELIERGVTVDILNMGRADNTPMGKLMIHILFAFAEFERDQIVERTMTGKAVKRAADPEWKDGRKKKQPQDFEKFLKMQKDGLITVDEAVSQLGISRRTWYNRVREAG